MTPKVVKSTSKGQITLPKEWRDQFHTDNFILQMGESQMILKPFYLSEADIDKEVIFDADRDNEGKGASPDEIIKILKKIQDEQN